MHRRDVESCVIVAKVIEPHSSQVIFNRSRFDESNIRGGKRIDLQSAAQRSSEQGFTQYRGNPAVSCGIAFSSTRIYIFHRSMLYGEVLQQATVEFPRLPIAKPITQIKHFSIDGQNRNFRYEAAQFAARL